MFKCIPDEISGMTFLFVKEKFVIQLKLLNTPLNGGQGWSRTTRVIDNAFMVLETRIELETYVFENLDYLLL